MGKIIWDKLANATVDAASYGNSVTLTFTARDNRFGCITLGANTTVTVSAASAFDQLVVTFKQAASYTVTWPVGITWAGGVAPVMPTGAGKKMMVTLYHDGDSLMGTARTDF